MTGEKEIEAWVLSYLSYCRDCHDHETIEDYQDCVIDALQDVITGENPNGLLREWWDDWFPASDGHRWRDSA